MLYDYKKNLRLLFQQQKRNKPRISKMESAVVLAKNTIDYVTQPSYISGSQVNTGLTEKGNVYRITFQNQRNPKEQTELEVSISVYDKIREGERGILVYKGTHLLQFGDIVDKNDKTTKFVGTNETFEEP